MRKNLSNIIRLVLVFMLISSVAMCIFWLPNAVDYAGKIFENAENFKNVKYLLYAIGYIIALPLFAVFIIAFRFPSAIETDSVFHKKTARLIKAISIIIFSDCTLFGAVVAWLFSIGERVLSPVLAFVDAIGFTVALMLLVLSEYVSRAAILKEEADYTI